MSPPPRLADVSRFLLLLLVFVTEALARRSVVIEANTTMSSENGTFELGFFSPDNGNSHFLGIWYSSVSPPTYIWVANREKPVKSLSTAAVEIMDSGELAITDSAMNSVTWRSESSRSGPEPSPSLVLFETGNLALVSRRGSIYWQSFDFPADTWLPGMNLTAEKGLLSWRSASDPSPGLYSLRMRPGYGEFELLFNESEPYWQTGSWTGDSFSNVPEMMVPYIYMFRFDRPYDPTASFGFSERALDNGSGIPLTRFRVDSSGLLRQYTWSAQTESWNMFWSQPAGTCRVFGTCGKFALCGGGGEKLCSCLSGFGPVNAANWESGDFSDGCLRLSGDCGESDDGFEKVGLASVGRSTGKASSFSSPSLADCKKACLESCDCVGIYHNTSTNRCRNLSGSLMNLSSAGSDSGIGVVLARVPKEGISKKKKKSPTILVLTATVIGSIAALGFLVVSVLLARNMAKRKKSAKEEEAVEGVFPMLSLKVFSYKELQQATSGFSEKVGQGGFGAVFRGKLADSTEVAVKRLERATTGSGEKEFRAEVQSIGNIQHVNLVRLLGFCSEESQRLLVYDFMPNGPLSGYLQSPTGPSLGWEARFRIAMGTARGIAYLHESCRDRIIHCDIKPENILLDSGHNPKVSDFGLAKLVGRDFSRVMATVRGTWGYVAPEWISGVPITAKADVYSFGMTLIELLGGRRNVRRSDDCWFFPPWAATRIAEGDVAAVVDRRLAADEGFDAEEARRVGMVAVWCVQDEEGDRPDMGTVLKMLQGVVPVPVPPMPNLLQALISGDSFTGDAGHIHSNDNAACADASESGNQDSPFN